MTSWVGLCWTFANTAAVIWIVLYVWEWMRCKRIISRLPAPSGGDLLGQLSVLSRPDHHDILTQWAAQLGGIYRMRLAHMNVRDFVVDLLCNAPTVVMPVSCNPCLPSFVDQVS